MSTLKRSEGATFSVGVDVDSLWHYYRIHGLCDADATDHAWSHGVPRFMELFESLNLPATFYCVAEDIERSPSCRQQLGELTRRGFEIGNHSWRHPYSLTTLTSEIQRAEIIEGKKLLEGVSGSEVSGFRAPGYHSHSSLHHPLIESGHRYESSAFPCAPYYLAKATIMGLMKITGRQSQSILGSPQILFAPRQPYLAGVKSPYRAARRDEREALAHFPIAVWGGLPLIGTLFALLGPRYSGWLGRRASRRLNRSGRHLTIEFHAADLLSLSEDQLDSKLSVQPDLKRSLSHKRRAFETFLSALSRAAHPIRLDQHPLCHRD